MSSINNSEIKLVVFNGDYTILRGAANEFLAKLFVDKYPKKSLYYARENYGCEDFMQGFNLCEFMLRKYKGVQPPKEVINHFERYFFEPVVLGWRKNLCEDDFYEVELRFYDGIQETIDILHQKGVSTAIFSSGPFPIHNRAKEKFGIGYCNATPIIFEDERYAGEGKREWNKGIVLTNYMKEIGFLPEETAVIEHSDLNICRAIMNGDVILGKIILLNPHQNMETFIEKYQDDDRFHFVWSNDLQDILPFLI